MLGSIVWHFLGWGYTFYKKKKMVKIEIKTLAGEVAFTWESEKNTIKETVCELLKKFKGKWIENVDLSNFDLSGINFSNSRFDNSSFDNSRFDNSSFDNSIFDNSRFDNSSFDNSIFDNSRFYNSRFDNSRFYNSRFDNSRFDNSSEIKKSCDLSNCYFNRTTFENKRYIQVSGIGSSKRFTTYCFEDNTIWCGCFKGTLAAFEKKVKETHKNNEQHLKEYLGFIEYLKSLK